MTLPATANLTGTNGTAVRTLADWDGARSGEPNGNICTIQSNAAQANARSGSAYAGADFWMSDTFGNDQYSQATVTAIASGAYVGVAVRCAGTDNAQDVTGYFFYSDSADGCYIDKYVNGTYVATLAGPGTAFAVNDVIRIEISGSSITAKVNGSTRLTATDSSITSGRAGICAYDSGTSAIDNWEGGNLSGGVTGSASMTQAGQTVAAAGAVAIAGAASITQATQTVASAGTVAITGAAAITQTDNTVAATGSAGNVPITGTAAITQDIQTVTAAGAVAIVGAAVVTQDGNATSATGTVAIVGSASITQDGNTVVARGDVLYGVCTAGVLTVSGDNSRYFENDDGLVVLAGFHTWYDVQDGGDTSPPSAFDWDEYLAALVSYGCNFTKLWRLESAQDWGGFPGQYFAQNAYPRTGPGTAADGGARFDLDSWNDEYFQRLRSRAIEAGNAGIFCCVQLFQGWHIDDKSTGSGDPWAYHPFENGNNINSVDGDINNDGAGYELRDTAQTALYNRSKAFVEKVIDTLNDLDHIIWEVSNEDTYSSTTLTWQRAIAAYIKSYEATKPKQHLVGITKLWPGGSNANLTGSTDADWISPDDDWPTPDPDEADGSQIILYDTDHVFGVGTQYHWIMQAFCQGNNLAYMDEWDGALYGTDRRADADYVLIRRLLGDALGYAAQIDMANATPQGSLSTTGWCIAKTTGNAQLFAYQDGTGAFDVTLTGLSGTFAVEWFRVSDGTTQAGSNVSGGAVRTLTPPWSGPVAAFLEVVGVSGTASITQDGNTVAAVGSVAIAATAALTQAGQTVAAAGVVTIAGASAITQDGQTVAATGAVAIVGAASVTQDTNTVAVAGAVAIVGAASVTQAGNTVAAVGFVGNVPIVGAATLTQDSQTAAATGVVDIAGVASVTQAGQTVAAAGAVAVVGSASATQDDNTVAATGAIDLILAVVFGSVRGTRATGTARGSRSTGSL